MLLPIKEILFATDLSKNADCALRYALCIAKGQNAKVHVLHVVEPLSLDATVTINMFMADKNERKQAIESRHIGMKEALKNNQKEFVKSLSKEEKEVYSLVISAELIDGHPAEAILDRAKSLNCDLIVMASHEQHTKQTFLGTVTKRVLRRSSIPVLVVPPKVL